MADIYMYEDIVSGSASKFVKDLDRAGGDDITLHVNCYGGDVFEGKTIMHRMRDYSGTITAVVEGVAASAASFIVAGGADRVVMREGSRMMVHNALSEAFGNANDLDKLSVELRGQSDDLARIYAERSGKPIGEWLAAMDAETWLTAEEAVAAGLADAVESGKPDPAVMATSRSRVMNLFRDRQGDPPAALLRRSESPNENNSTSSDGQEDGEKMNILNQFLEELKNAPAETRKEFAGFLNEVVPISGEVNVTYPADAKIIPTQTIKIEPIVGDKPAEGADGSVEVVPEGEAAAEPAGDSAAVQLAKSAGLTFAMGEVAEGWTAEVDEGGIVTVKAPSGAEVGATADFTVQVNETAVPLSVTVRAFDEEPEGETPPADPAANPAAVTNSADMITVPRDHFNYLNKVAKNFGKAQAELTAQANAKRVDEDIAAGRFAAAHRAKALGTLERDPQAYATVWGSLPKNTIPVREVGHTGGGEPQTKADALLAKANSNRSNKKGA